MILSRCYYKSSNTFTVKNTYKIIDKINVAILIHCLKEDILVEKRNIVFKMEKN